MKEAFLSPRQNMRKHHLHICLFEPEIPQNTGNIARLAAATSCRLHLIQPFGFSVSDKNLRRAGLDYWPYLDLEIHSNLSEFLELFEPSKVAFLSTKGSKVYTEMPQDTQAIVFGRETSGLPPWIYQDRKSALYKIPIFHPSVRSLNLANSVSIVLYHAMMQRHGGGMQELSIF